MLSYDFPLMTMSDYCIKRSKQSFYSMKNPLIINLKGKLQKPSDFFLRCQTRRAVFGLLTCWLKYHVVLSCGGIGQFNYDNRSQQHVEAIYGSLTLSVLHVLSKNIQQKMA